MVRVAGIAAALALVPAMGTCHADAGDVMSVIMSLPSPNGLRARGPMGGSTFQMHLRYDSGLRQDITSNGRDRFFAVARSGSHVFRSYELLSARGAVLYSSTDGGAWEKIDLFRLATRMPQRKKPSSGAGATGRAASRNVPGQWLPDRTVAGRTYHVYGEFKPSSGGRARSLVVKCLVDMSGLLRSCVRPGLYSVTIDHYDDPRNDFVLPEAVRNARDVTDL